MAEFSDQARLDRPIGGPDHVRGAPEAPVALVLYGDYQCPFTARVIPLVEEILDQQGNGILYAYRCFPLVDIHPDAQTAAEAAEAAAAQGRFWEMHWTLFVNQRHLDALHLLRYARNVGLDEDRFLRDLESGAHARRVEEDRASGSRSGVRSTPTFFVNGFRYDGGNEGAEIRHALRHAPPPR